MSAEINIHRCITAEPLRKHIPPAFQSGYRVSVTPIRKKATINKSFSFDWHYVQLLTGARAALCWEHLHSNDTAALLWTPSRAPEALVLSRLQRGIQGPASRDGNQIMNKFYILTHLISSAAQAEGVLPGIRWWFPLSRKTPANVKVQNTHKYADAHSDSVALLLTRWIWMSSSFECDITAGIQKQTNTST